jgi:Chemotaxis signal transduction protein
MEPNKKYLLFRVGEVNYAVSTADVREIVTGISLYTVPFVPRWIRGVLNRHGEPYTVLDIGVLAGGEPLQADSCILLNRADDQIAVLIQSVVEFVEADPLDMHRISSPDEETAWFSGSLAVDGREVMILDIDRILGKMADDVRTA